MSDTQGFIGGVVAGQGNLCLAGQLGRFHSELLPAPSTGLFIARINLSALPFSPPQQVVAGGTWNFQAWYRDDNPGSTSNLTDATTLTFQ